MANAELAVQPYIKRHRFTLPSNTVTAREYYYLCRSVMPGFTHVQDAQRRANALAYIALYKQRYGVPHPKASGTRTNLDEAGSRQPETNEMEAEKTTNITQELQSAFREPMGTGATEAVPGDGNDRKADSAGDKAAGIGTEHIPGPADDRFDNKTAEADKVQANDAARFACELTRRMTVRAEWDRLQYFLVSQRPVLDEARETGNPVFISGSANPMTATVIHLIQLAESLDGFKCTEVADEWLGMARKLRFLQYANDPRVEFVESFISDYDGLLDPEKWPNEVTDPLSE